MQCKRCEITKIPQRPPFSSIPLYATPSCLCSLNQVGLGVFLRVIFYRHRWVATPVSQQA
nr:MAG TPA: hypothetical protein [Caudoviricetes sp.]